MTTIVTINGTFADHLAYVTDKMREMGAPAIRCIRDDAQGVIVALEGSHRIAAAKALGLAPVLTILEDDDVLTCDEIGYDDCGWFDGEAARAVDIRDRIAGSGGDYSGCAFVDLDDVVIR